MPAKTFAKVACSLILFSLSLAVLVACRGQNPASSSAGSSPPAAAASPANAATTASPASDTNAAPDLEAGLTAYYPFNGNARDESGNGNDGLVNGATLTADRFGRPDSAYAFDGVDDYLTIPDGDGLDLTFASSISVWLYYEPQASRDFYTILEKSDPERDGHSRYGMWIIEDRAEFCIEPASHDFQRCLDAEIPLKPQSWHHLVGTYDGATLSIYIDGQPAGQQTNPRSAIAQNTFELFIGTDLYQARTLYTLGKIDDIRIYKRVLSEAEVQALYQAQP